MQGTAEQHVAIDLDDMTRRVRAAVAAAGATVDEIDESTQHAVVETWSRDGAIRDRTKLVSYAVTVAYRDLFARRRAAARMLPMGSVAVDRPAVGDRPEQVMEQLELRQALTETLAQLSERDRYLAVASIEGVDVGTIAAVTGLACQSVPPSTHRARRRWAAALAMRGIDGRLAAA